MKKRTEPPGRKEALDLVLGRCGTAASETVRLEDAAGRILRKAVAADRDVPPFDRAVMDGWAVRSADLKAGSARLSVAAEIPAGAAWEGRIERGFCAKIMTGAPVPPGADSVVKVEDSRVLADGTVILEPSESGPGTFVHPQGSDMRAGAVGVPAGVVIGRFHMAALAGFGAASVEVARRVRVHVLTTGTEVLPTASKPKTHQIRNVTGPGLLSLLGSMPFVEARFMGIAGDDEKSLCRAFERALKGCDVLVATGGVSKGDFDLVPKVLESLGAKQVFHGVAMRPGRPLWFGAAKDRIVFGLPGNPVSVFVGAHVFLAPALRKTAGVSDPLPRSLLLRLRAAWRKDHPLEEARIAWVSAEKGGISSVMPMEYSGSADYLAAMKSDGLAFIPSGVSEVKAGTAIEFQPWGWQD